MPPDPPSRHACVKHEHAFMRYYHLATILFPPPNSKSCIKPCSCLVATSLGTIVFVILYNVIRSSVIVYDISKFETCKTFSVLMSCLQLHISAPVIVWYFIKDVPVRTVFQGKRTKLLKCFTNYLVKLSYHLIYTYNWYKSLLFALTASFKFFIYLPYLS